MTVLTPVAYRQLRGLAVHFRRVWPDIRRSRSFSRGLFGTFASRGGTAGVCRWCGLPTIRRLRWHLECVWAYRAATGQSVTHLWASGRPPCPCGAEAEELDHRDALVLAWTSGDPRRLVRAYGLSNLVWLCRGCHLAKTAEDLCRLSEMRSGQVCLLGMVMVRDGDMGVRRWACVEGGLVGDLTGRLGQLTGVGAISRRRGPVTFRPEAATCPRCLAVMEQVEQVERVGAGRAGMLLGMPRGWHLDERRAEMEARLPGMHMSGPFLAGMERRGGAAAAGQMEFASLVF